MRKLRIRAQLEGTQKRPRVSIFRSHRYLYVQLIDDDKRQTLLGMNEKKEGDFKLKNNLDRAKVLGEKFAQKAQSLKVKQVVFDRSGYAYHGRIKALAEGLRQGGLKF